MKKKKSKKKIVKILDMDDLDRINQRIQNLQCEGAELDYDNVNVIIYSDGSIDVDVD